MSAPGNSGRVTGSRRQARPNGTPWQPIEDACDSIVKRLSDPTAMEGMGAAATAHYAITALGKALSNIGKNNVDTIAIDPRVSAYMEGLGQYVLKAAQPTEEVGASIVRAHQSKIDRIVEANPKEMRWDVSANLDGKPVGRHRMGRRRAG
jgi:hypothetical protein